MPPKVYVSELRLEDSEVHTWVVRLTRLEPSDMALADASAQ